MLRPEGGRVRFPSAVYRRWEPCFCRAAISHMEPIRLGRSLASCARLISITALTYILLKMSDPLISVIIPCFNGAKSMARAVASVLDQNVPGEIVIVDDGS